MFVFVCMTYMYLYAHLCVYTCVCVGACGCMYDIYVRVCIYMCVCVHTHTCMSDWSSPLQRPGYIHHCFLLTLSNSLPGNLGSELKPYVFFLFVILAKSAVNHDCLSPKGVLGRSSSQIHSHWAFVSICLLSCPLLRCVCHTRHIDRGGKRDDERDSKRVRKTRTTKTD